MTEQTPQNIQDKILNQIKDKNIQMTSKKFFYLKWLTMFVTSIFFLGVAFYIFAYVTFLFVDNGIIYIPIFTTAGLVNFIIEIPWTLVLLGIFSIFLFSITSKTFYKIYRKPFLTFFFSILIIIMISHIILLESGAMKRLKQEAYNMGIQLVPNKFLQFRDSQTGSLFVGKIIGTTTNSVIIIDRKNISTELILENTIDINAFFIGALVNAYATKVNGQFYVNTIEIIE